MICTFYSFKGGVGRTMALARVTLLHDATWSHDWEHWLKASGSALQGVPRAAHSSRMAASAVVGERSRSPRSPSSMARLASSPRRPNSSRT